MAFLVNKKDEGAVSELPWKEVVPFEAPRPRARILIFTLFNAHEFSYIFDLSSSVPMPNLREKFSTRTFAPNNFWPIGLPISREKFSTRTFASNNALGSPLGAAYFIIKPQRENDSSKVMKKASRKKRMQNGAVRKNCSRKKLG